MAVASSLSSSTPMTMARFGVKTFYFNELDLLRLRSTTLVLRLLREVGAALMLTRKDFSRKAGMVRFWYLFEHQCQFLRVDIFHSELRYTSSLTLKRWGYCQREGCEFRSPVLGSSSSSRPSTGFPSASDSSSPPPVTEGTENSTQLITDAPIIITPLPLLPLPDLLPPPGTPISIPCGMFDPIQVKSFSF